MYQNPQFFHWFQLVNSGNPSGDPSKVEAQEARSRLEDAKVPWVQWLQWTMLDHGGALLPSAW